MATNFISHDQKVFIQHELNSREPGRVKRALQNLAWLHRNGFCLKPDQLHSMEITINGLLLQNSQNAKVVRWGLNNIALWGRYNTSHEYVRQALRLHIGEPEIEAAGAAAMFHLHKLKAYEMEDIQSLDPTLTKLAALQVLPSSEVDLSDLRINIEKDDPEVLKLALITIGLNKDVENMFDPRFPNSEIVRELGKHDNLLVQQYSIWAIIENRSLDIGDLGINYGDLENLKPNVQSKMLELVSSSENDLQCRLNMIEQSQYLPSSLARQGSVKGMRNAFFEGLENVTLDWYDQEVDPVTKTMLAEHFVVEADKCAAYNEKAQNIFEDKPALRKQLLAAAQGKTIYPKLKKLALTPDNLDLFDLNQKSFSMLSKEEKTAILPTLKSLFLAASPLDLERLRLGYENQGIMEQVRSISDPKVTVNIEPRMAAQADKLKKYILEEKPDIIHFSGHGDTNYLYFEDQKGDAKNVSAKAFADLIKCVGNQVKCVILNACNSSEFGRHLKPHVKYVIGCSDSISDEASIAFSCAFYRDLARGRPIETAFEFAKSDVYKKVCLSEAKKFTIQTNTSQ